MSNASRMTLCASAVSIGAVLTLAGCGGGESGGNSSAAAPTGPIGKDVFAANCAVCHGEMGRGDGITAASLPVTPRDLTSEPYKYVDIPGHDTEVAALVDYIKVGRQENGMPPFKDSLTEEQIRAAAEFVAGLRPKPNYVEELPADGGGEAPADEGGDG